MNNQERNARAACYLLLAVMLYMLVNADAIREAVFA